MKFTREHPPIKTDYWRRYRPYTRRDFQSICAYCFRHEDEAGGEAGFVQDHFEPKHRQNVDPANYFNLYWCCVECNSPRYKGSKWPTPEQLACGECFCDPCHHDPVGTDYVETNDWTLTSLTLAGGFTVRQIRLSDRESLRKCRERRALVKSLYQRELANLRGALIYWTTRLAERPSDEAREKCDSLRALVEAYEVFLARDPFMLHHPLPPDVPQELTDAIHPRPFS